jgi:hypothetical protein
VSESNVIVSNEPWKKPLPNIDKDNEEFYEGLKTHKFLVWRCKTCGACYWPKAYCINHENEPFATNMSGRSRAGRDLPSTATTWRFIPLPDEIPTSMRALIRLRARGRSCPGSWSAGSAIVWHTSLHEVVATGIIRKVSRCHGSVPPVGLDLLPSLSWWRAVPPHRNTYVAVRSPHPRQISNATPSADAGASASQSTVAISGGRHGMVS